MGPYLAMRQGGAGGRVALAKKRRAGGRERG